MDSQSVNRISKPKVHRLPKKASGYDVKYVLRLVFMVCVAVVVVGAIPAVMAYKKWDVSKKAVVAEAVPVPVNVVPNDTADQVTVYGEHGEVVGQISELPSDEEQLMQVKTMKKIDSATGKELLAIIGKY
jgi:hypothetical protein